MKPETKANLDRARSNLGRCAAKISARRSGTRSLSESEREMVVGLGTAKDWIRWATALKDLSFSTKTERDSARRQGITEAVRFNQLWTATNALFAKDSILAFAALPLALSTNVKKSEPKRFQVLYNSAGVDACFQCTCLKTLSALLSMECRSAGLIGVLKADSTPTIWEIIFWKYMRPEDRRRSIGKVIGTALDKATAENAKSGKANRRDQPMPVADGPMLIYAARNWAVHGMLLTSFFRGSRQKYITFIDNITLLLSAVLDGAARNLLTKL